LTIQVVYRGLSILNCGYFACILHDFLKNQKNQEEEKEIGIVSNKLQHINGKEYKLFGERIIALAAVNPEKYRCSWCMLYPAFPLSP